MLARYDFRPGLVPTLVALVVLAMLLSLGRWQLERAAEKERAIAQHAERQAQAHQSLTAAIGAALPGFTQVWLQGRFDEYHQFLLDNRTHLGRAGYHVITPFLTDAEGVVLVNRGWVPASADRSELPDIRIVSAGSIVITGMLVPPRESQFVLGETGYASDVWPKVVQRVELGPIGTALRRDVVGYVLRLDPNAENGYLRDWRPHLGISPDRHRGYATQWFALAATLAVIYIVLTVRRRATSKEDSML